MQDGHIAVHTKTGSPKSCGGRRRGFYASYLKRGFDLFVVLAAVPFLVPLVLLLALLVRRDGGPAFFVQERVGQGGRLFRLWKLRTMVVDADRRLTRKLAASPAARIEWEETQKLKDDPRITRLGRILRRTSLDELPQLWNVLSGAMSVVGPRPLIPDEAELVGGRHVERNRVRPGITGPWQVLGRSDIPFEDMVSLDYMYVATWTLREDARILVRTVGAIGQARGAY
jgi:exopolysaccharide production protein ExoY